MNTTTTLKDVTKREHTGPTGTRPRVEWVITMSDDEAWETVGRDLLQCELEITGGELYTSINMATGAVSRGEPVDQDQIDDIYRKLRDVHHAIDQLAEATGNEPEPDIMELLDDDELQAVGDRIASDQHGIADGGEVSE